MSLLSLLSASCLFFSAGFLNAHDPSTESAGNRRAAQEFLAAVGDVQEGRQTNPVPVGADPMKASVATTAALSFLAIAGFAFAGAGFRKRR